MRPDTVPRRSIIQAGSYALASLALFLGALVQGASGFAFSLVSLPLLTLAMPAGRAVPMLTLFGLAINSIVLFSARSRKLPAGFPALLTAGAAGTVPGVLLLGSVPEVPLAIGVGLTVALIAGAYLAGFRAGLSRSRAAVVPVGLLSGVMNGLMTFSGPPVIILLTERGAGRDEFRAGLAFYFLGLNLLTVPMLASAGLLDVAVLAATAELLPAAAAGAILGSALSGRIPQDAFRRAVLVLLAILGLSAAARAAF